MCDVVTSLPRCLQTWPENLALNACRWELLVIASLLSALNFRRTMLYVLSRLFRLS